MSATPSVVPGDSGRRLGSGRLASFGAPSFVLGMTAVPVYSILPNFYAQHTAVTMATIGVVFFIVRLLDAVTDPLIAYLSDRTRTRIGARKPWMAGGTLVIIVSVLFLFQPPPTATAWYFGTWFAVLTLGWTIVEIPYRAWAADLSPLYHERSRVFFAQRLFRQCGAFTLVMIPFLPFFATTEMGESFFRFAAILIALALPVLVLLTLVAVPAGIAAMSSMRVGLRDTLVAVGRNPPLRILLIAAFVSGTGSGVYSALLALLVDATLGIGDRMPHVFAIAFFGSIIALPVWLRILRRWGKHRPTAIAGFVQAGLFLTLLGLQQEYAFWHVAAITFSFGLLLAGEMIASPAMIADCVDYAEWKTGRRPTANLYASVTLLEKAIGGLGAAIGFWMLAAFGYDAVAGHPERNLQVMLITIAVLPALGNAAGAWLFWVFPLDERRQRILRKRIESRGPLPATDDALRHQDG
jgi:glycoside/pentoside/hexuronide:cation symporter, GPH family